MKRWKGRRSNFQWKWSCYLCGRAIFALKKMNTGYLDVVDKKVSNIRSKNKKQISTHLLTVLTTNDIL